MLGCAHNKRLAPHFVVAYMRTAPMEGWKKEQGSTPHGDQTYCAHHQQAFPVAQQRCDPAGDGPRRRAVQQGVLLQ